MSESALEINTCWLRNCLVGHPVSSYRLELATFVDDLHQQLLTPVESSSIFIRFELYCRQFPKLRWIQERTHIQDRFFLLACYDAFGSSVPPSFCQRNNITTGFAWHTRQRRQGRFENRASRYDAHL